MYMTEASCNPPGASLLERRLMLDPPNDLSVQHHASQMIERLRKCTLLMITTSVSDSLLQQLLVKHCP
jgi:hypothetical protein